MILPCILLLRCLKHILGSFTLPPQPGRIAVSSAKGLHQRPWEAKALVDQKHETHTFTKG